MKNQYFGDVGDYGKYALLRFLANSGIKVAVNWYLTSDDGTNDGKHVAYLKDPYMRKYDDELFDLLSEMLERGCRDVIAFEKEEAINGAVYFHNVIDDTPKSRIEKKKLRMMWHLEALHICEGAELVFLDPDNGACEHEPQNAKQWKKYCYANEIADYYNRGQNVVYYCSKGRRTYSQWEETKSLMQRTIPDARVAVITFHKGTQRSYIFVLHEKDYRKYDEIIKKFLETWPRIFTEECDKTGVVEG